MSAYNWTVPADPKGHNVSISITAVDEGGFSSADESGWLTIGEVTPAPIPVDGTWIIVAFIVLVVLMSVILIIQGRKMKGIE